MTSDWRLDDTMYFFSRRAWSIVPRSLVKTIRVDRSDHPRVPKGVIPCVFLFASEIVGKRMSERLTGPDVRYAILVDDVPLPSLIDIPALLSLHRPELRAHWTKDHNIVRRAVVSLFRDQRREAILDAHIYESRLTVLLADLKRREVDTAEISSLRRVKSKSLSDFRVDENGSYLHWPSADVHLGVSQILEAIDPEYLAQIEIERNALDYSGWAIEGWRREQGLAQVEIAGLGERQVRRIEQGVSRLTAPAAAHFARAFGMTTGAFLDELAVRTRETRESVESAEEADYERDQSIVVFETAA